MMVTKKALVPVLLACSLLFTAQASFAQPGSSHREGHHSGEYRHRVENNRAHHYNSRQPRAHHSGYAHAPRRAAAHFHQGSALPHEYHASRYHVSDWRRHGLYAPPRGHHWISVDGDFVLIAAATGVIASILFAH